ncbi:MAG: hypothetical protein ABW118_19285 [Candidatus Thiodiazotropha sp.]
MGSKRKSKRQPSSDTDSDDHLTQSQAKRQTQSASQLQSTSQMPPTSTMTSRFLVVSSLEENRSISSLSPFVIYKNIKAIAGEPKSVKTLRSGDLLIECERESHIKNLLGTTTFFGIKCQVKLHATLNSSKGILRCQSLKDSSDEHILEEMRDQRVVGVRRIKVRRDGELKPTNTFVLTFSTPDLPSTVNIGYLRERIEVYIPNPLRCYRCQMFGHHEDNCRRSGNCVNCGEPQHTTEDTKCTQQSKCFNCSGNHAANSRDCPSWLKEKEIMRIKYTRNISFQEARQIIENAGQSSFADITRSAMHMVQRRDAATQTDPVKIIPVSAEEAKTTRSTAKEVLEKTGLKKGTVEMIKKDSARASKENKKETQRLSQKERVQTARDDKQNSRRTISCNNSFSPLQDTTEDDDSVIFAEPEDQPPGVPKGTLNRIGT